jgi:Family of unknown function (DUF5681)
MSKDEWTTEWPDDQVGYKRPPKKHQFKRGQSGNPRGRPKNARSSNRILKKFIQEEIIIVANGERRRMTRYEYLINTIYVGAVKGNAKSSALLMHMIKEQGLIEKEFASDEMRIIVVGPDDAQEGGSSSKGAPPARLARD